MSGEVVHERFSEVCDGQVLTQLPWALRMVESFRKHSVNDTLSLESIIHGTGKLSKRVTSQAGALGADAVAELLFDCRRKALERGLHAGPVVGVPVLDAGDGCAPLECGLGPEIL